MARFDVHRNGDLILLDCQLEYFEHLTTRFVVPLIPHGEAPVIDRKLNPMFKIDERWLVMQTQHAGAVYRHQLGPAILSLASDDLTIKTALDFLISGF